MNLVTLVAALTLGLPALFLGVRLVRRWTFRERLTCAARIVGLSVEPLDDDGSGPHRHRRYALYETLTGPFDSRVTKPIGVVCPVCRELHKEAYLADDPRVRRADREAAAVTLHSIALGLAYDDVRDADALLELLERRAASGGGEAVA